MKRIFRSEGKRFLGGEPFGVESPEARPGHRTRGESTPDGFTRESTMVIAAEMTLHDPPFFIVGEEEGTRFVNRMFPFSSSPSNKNAIHETHLPQREKTFFERGAFRRGVASGSGVS